MLKFSLKQQRLSFTDGWAVTEDELEYYADDDEDSADLLGKLTLEIREDGIDIDEVIHIVGQDNDTRGKHQGSWSAYVLQFVWLTGLGRSF